MKHTILCLIAGMTLVACTKSGTTSTNNATTDPNKVTVSDNGTTYTASGTYPSPTGKTPVMVSILKSTSSILEIQCGGTGAQFILGIQATGPANGLGTYAMAQGSAITVYTETFSGGQAYAADSGTVNVTTASSTNVTGTFQVWLHGGKVITGSVNASNPQIQ